MGNAGAASTIQRIRSRSGQGGNAPIPVTVADGARERLSAIAGRPLTDRHFIGLIGAVPGERVTVTRHGEIQAHQAAGFHQLTLFRSEGALAATNQGYMAHGAPRMVAATDAARLARQVDMAHALGIHDLHVKASPGTALTLLRMGYDSPIATVLPFSGNSELAQHPPDALMRGAQTLHDLLRTASGTAFVRQHLRTPDLHFDTRLGSLSRNTLQRYRSRHRG